MFSGKSYEARTFGEDTRAVCKKIKQRAQGLYWRSEVASTLENRNFNGLRDEVAIDTAPARSIGSGIAFALVPVIKLYDERDRVLVEKEVTTLPKAA